MLYKLNGINGRFDKIEPLPFKDFSSFGQREKDLEDLIAQSILDVLFEDASLIGRGADERLIYAADGWGRRGVSISFLPNRVYELCGNHYFEFFALPYDRHKNPADAKGVLFDTNRSWDEESIWYMIENSRVA